jgi:pilus assembly protein CpaB
MNNSNETRTLWISLAAGVFAAFLLYSYSQEKKSEYDKVYGVMKNVVIAKVDIIEMQTIDDTMLEVVQRPTDFLQPGATQDPEAAVGQVAAAPIKKGEQILQTKLLQPGPDTGISLQVAPSKRAVTLPVDEVRGVAKLIRPGDRVDIVAAIDSGKGVNQKREVAVIMQDVVILATGVNVVNNIPRTFELDSGSKNVNQISLSGSTSYTTLTIEATPKEAQDLIYIQATASGSIYFTLRNPNDRAVQPRLPSSTSESLVGRSPASLDLGSRVNSVPVTIPTIQKSVAPQRLPAKRAGGFRDL